MRSCTTQEWRAFHASNGVAANNARKVAARPELKALAGHQVSFGTSAEIVEFALPNGEVIARRVETPGNVACWLRDDLLRQAQAWIEQQDRETQRIIDEMVAFVGERTAKAPEPLRSLSRHLVEAAARHSARLGRLHDTNSRGDAERGKFVKQLAEARRQEEEEQ